MTSKKVDRDNASGYVGDEALVSQQEAYREAVSHVISGEVTPATFKAFSGGMGVYPQKGSERFMLRARVDAGILNLQDFTQLVTLAEVYSEGWVHLTTRQDIQYHDVRVEDTWPLMSALMQGGIWTIGAGGNSIRNVSCDIPEGIHEDADSATRSGNWQDVSPYARTLVAFALRLEGMKALPRKFKIAFSGSEADRSLARFSDLGFVATVNAHGHRGFKVYGGGGLGRNPKKAVLLSPFVKPEEIFEITLGMKALFEAHGNREDRNQARIRYILERLGLSEFQRIFWEYVADSRQSEQLDYWLKQLERAIHANDKRSLLDQTHGATRHIELVCQHGNLDSKTSHALLEHLRKQALEGSVSPLLRLTKSQNLWVGSLTEETYQGILSDNRLHHSDSDLVEIAPVFKSVSCIGANRCAIGILPAPELLERIWSRVEPLPIQVVSKLPQLWVSGCHNGCGLHQVATLGLFGKVLKVGEEKKAFYSVSIGNHSETPDANSERELAIEIGDIAADELPEFMVKLAALVQANGYPSYDTWLASDRHGMIATLEQHLFVRGRD